MLDYTEIDLKLNDAWCTHYARKFITKYPEHKDFFRFRKSAYLDVPTEE